MARKPRKTPPAAPPPAFDGFALIARMRAGDEAALGEAYRATFGSELGRLVLADIAQMAGVGGRFGGEKTDATALAYHQGGHDLAVDILTRAGFDQASTIAMVFTGRLEGPDYEPAAGGYAEHDPEFD
ncbi:hypothetical protein [Phenylobacterium sp. SCN 70-31]|uniref:Bbp19 family protein n=1 Tax=Phenylobacterium sp. SCN 70-31 TaxID=1660129 RepID=UPI00086DA6B4|nr:hypothetical protein [Phenylobacterium sp. SCN 70-31]ODT88113.1 MAG: hypothetical protein ABS78_09485 [Phenylobacterium sp. SCN 70-31]